MTSNRRRSTSASLLACVLAVLLASGGTLAIPALTGLGRDFVGAGVARAAVHPLAPELVRALEGGQAISRGSDGRLTVLLLGSDYRPTLAGERTDIIIVMTINPRTKQMAAVSIPRDIARLPLPNGTIYKGRVNTLFSYYRKRLGSRDAALNEVRRVIASLLRVEIDYHALVRMPAYNALVDNIGGVTVKIPSEIRDGKYWDDPRGPQGIYFPASAAWELSGNTTLCNGYYKKNMLAKPGARCQRALVYVRTRKGVGNSDFKRTRRAQDVVAAAIGKVVNRGNGANLNSLVSAASLHRDGRNLDTNIAINAANALELHALFAGASLDQQAVLSPTTYAVKIPYTLKYQLKLAEVRALTAKWFAPLS